MITRCLLTRTFFYMECTYRVMKMFLKVQQHFEYWLTKKGTSILRWCSLCVLCWICYKHRMQLAAWVVEREFFFSVRLLSVERGLSVFSSRHNGQWPPTLKDFYTRSYPLHYFLILILEKEPVFPLSMLSAKQGNAKQGNYWYHFITALVWRGPWLGIEPGTSRTRSQYSTTRLSRRRSGQIWLYTCRLLKLI